MSKTLNEHMDEVFPHAGGFDHLQNYITRWAQTLPENGRGGEGKFPPAAAEKIDQVFALLEGDELARALLAHYLKFAQLNAPAYLFLC
ncbi:MAG: hypothetical protein WDN10_05065 [bacterium]